jgi:hypothetical protein
VKQLGAKATEIRPSPFGGKWAGGDIELTLTLKDRKGGDWSEWPEDLRVRQFPEGKLVRLIRGALNRADPDRPPSESDTVAGPLADRILARLAGWTGDPSGFVDACCSCSHPVLERVPGGVRVRGMKRYDSTWAKNKRRGHGLDEAEDSPETSRAGPARVTGGSRSVPGPQDPDPDPDRDLDPDPDHRSPPPPPPAAEASETAPDGHAGEASQVSGIAWAPTPRGLWSFILAARAQAGLPPEPRQPRGFDGWAAAQLAKYGKTAIECAFVDFLGDVDIRKSNRPTAVFMSAGVFDHRAEKYRYHEKCLGPAELPP